MQRGRFVIFIFWFWMWGSGYFIWRNKSLLNQSSTLRNAEILPLTGFFEKSMDSKEQRYWICWKYYCLIAIIQKKKKKKGFAREQTKESDPLLFYSLFDFEFEGAGFRKGSFSWTLGGTLDNKSWIWLEIWVETSP